MCPSVHAVTQGVFHLPFKVGLLLPALKQEEMALYSTQILMLVQ